MKKSDRPLFSWKRYGLQILNSFYSWLPFFPELLTIHSKALGIMRAWHLVSRNGVDGDYFEFGVFQGDTFRLSLKTARNSFASSSRGKFSGRFFAFDSFEGLPHVQSVNDEQNIFAGGEYSSTEGIFLKTIASVRRDEEVHVIKGWFENTLVDDLYSKYTLKKAAVVNVDCDLYESTMTCLNFVVPLLQDGTVLMFDDWFLMKGSMQKGEPLAAAEWLRKNPQIKLTPWETYGVAGMMFIVNVTESDSPFYLKVRSIRP